ncbi:MAG: hypothetical protein ACO2ZM_01585 [Francisellaceae bacterium]
MPFSKPKSKPQALPFTFFINVLNIHSDVAFDLFNEVEQEFEAGMSPTQKAQSGTYSELQSMNPEVFLEVAKRMKARGLICHKGYAEALRWMKQYESYRNIDSLIDGIAGVKLINKAIK